MSPLAMRADTSLAVKPAYVPWFPQQKARDMYISLLSLNPPPPQPILIAALLRRAMEVVLLIWASRDAKAALTILLQRGQIGDELWERFLLAEKELEAEIVEVVGEANTFSEGYGATIFGVASEMVSHEKFKQVYRSIPKEREAESRSPVHICDSSLTRAAEARMALGAPSAVLAPLSYLTPSSLTLVPSNPSGQVPSELPPSVEAAPAPSPLDASIAKQIQIVEPPARIPPPSPAAVPIPPPESLPIAPPSPSPAPPSATEEDDDGEEDPIASGATTPLTSGTQSPINSTKSSAKKPKKKKKKSTK